MKPRTKQKEGETVLDHEGGNRFFHRHLSKKARKKKRKARKAARHSRKKRG